MKQIHRLAVSRVIVLCFWVVVTYSLYYHKLLNYDTGTAVERAVKAKASDVQNKTSVLLMAAWFGARAGIPEEKEVEIIDAVEQLPKHPGGEAPSSSSTVQPIPPIIPTNSSKAIQQPKIHETAGSAPPGPAPLSPAPTKSATIPAKPVVEKSVVNKPEVVKPPPVVEKPVAQAVTNNSVVAKLVPNTPAAPVKTVPTTLKPSTTPATSIDEYKNMGGISMGQNYTGPVNPHPFKFTISPVDACSETGESGVFLLVYIHTRPDSIKKRELIRLTWGNVNNYNVTVRRLFVMGFPENDYVEDAVRLESSLYNDIVQEDFIDHYRNLTYKAVGALKWVTKYCSKARFVLKTDDDAFVNLPLLLQNLTSYDAAGAHKNRSIMCNAWTNSEVARQGKWAVTLEQRKHPSWPTFCQGLAFVMTTDVVAALYNVSFNVPFLWMDDVYVTGFLTRRIELVHTQMSQFFIREGALEKLLDSPAEWRNAVFSHVQDYNLRLRAWHKIVKLMSLEQPKKRS